jgi:hypothetical protein
LQFNCDDDWGYEHYNSPPPVKNSSVTAPVGRNEGALATLRREQQHQADLEEIKFTAEKHAADQALKKQQREDEREELQYQQDLRAAEMKRRRVEAEEDYQAIKDAGERKRELKKLAFQEQLADQEQQFEDQRVANSIRQHNLLMQQEMELTTRRTNQEDLARARKKEDEADKYRHLELLASYKRK